jgi:hypothetical protein
MTPHASIATLALVGALAPAAADAAADLRAGRAAGAVTVYPDDQRPDLFYYGPGDLAMATAPDGEPDLHFLHARYTGSAATADRGTTTFRSVLTFRIRMSGPTGQQIADARRTLAGRGRTIELRPLPIRRLESALVYVPAAAESPSSSSRSLSDGHFEQADDAAAPREGYWTERIYTVGLAEIDAQLLAAAFDRGGVALSVGYAFFAEGIGPDVPLETLSGSPELVAALQKQIESRESSTDKPRTQLPAHLVKAGAVSVAADLTRWPSLMKKVDINASVPPGYAAVDVYCYDFNATEQPALYEKQIEIEADGVGGRKVRLSTTFSRSQPDLYARSLRFPVAVRLDRPYRFRVIAIGGDGTAQTGTWQERDSWSALLDVTAPADPAAHEGEDR